MEFKLLSKLKSLNLLFPIEVIISIEIKPTHHQGELCLVHKKSKIILFPLNFYFKEFFKNNNLIETLLDRIEDLMNKPSFENFVQGSV